MLYYLSVTILLALVYLAMTSNLEPANLVVGLLLGAAVVALIRPDPLPTQPRNFPRAFLALVRYLALLIYDLIVSGLQVARIVLSPSLPIQQGIIAIPADTQTDLGAALSAHAITLTPGELVVEMDEDHVLYTHCLDATDAAETVKAAVDVRREMLDQIFG